MSDPIRLLVLGGTAWLGRTVAAASVAAGDHVTCLARGESGTVPPGTTLVRGDRERPGSYDAVTGQEFDAVVDVARVPAHVESAVSALGPRTGHWVFVSTGNVYADQVTTGTDETGALLAPLPPTETATPQTYGPAKVACEQAVLRRVGPQRSLIARAGLIGGPGDEFDRSGYWPWRLSRPATTDGTVLVPDVPDQLTSVIDVRDLADFLLLAARERIAGTYDTVGRPIPFAEHLTTARLVAGHVGPLLSAAPDWLTEQHVQPWMGERSLPLWLPADFAGLNSRPGTRARGVGLVTRPLADTLADTLTWELSRRQPAPRRAGLTDADEADLLQRLL